jgi:adenine-specific DNA-methyltransferase
MGLIEDLVAKVQDDYLRTEIQSALATLKRQRRFGLVFEEHIPETSALLDYPVRPGALVELRRESSDSRSRFRVIAVTHGGTRARLGPESGEGEEAVLPIRDLVVVKPFGEPIYPALRSVGSVERGGVKPHHAVIDAENFHALQLLVYLYRGQVDCIYIDPPYNTGARDWKYNNHYVDSSDTWRHSKWLSMIDRRLRLAKKLLKSDGVLIVTIDENELNHLGVLLEERFPEARRQLVTICINPGGASGGDGLSRVEEYAFFCFLGDAQPSLTQDDMLVTGADADVVHTGAQGVRWEWLLRGGNAWYRSSRPNLCYPILLSDDATRIVGTGSPLASDIDSLPSTIDGRPVAWPLRRDGKLGIWRVDAGRLRWLNERGYVYVSARDDARGTWTIKYLMEGTVDAIEAGLIDVVGHGDRGEVHVQVSERRGKTAKTMWYRGRHVAGGAGGTHLLNELLGARNLFPFPKSVYAVRDCLEVAVGDRKDALILDFFAGSGTTAHAVCLMNVDDDGTRRSVMVTNNEVNAETSRRLNRAGHFRGDSEFDQHGIFESVTAPRCRAAVSGGRPDGAALTGSYLTGRPLADGFAENFEFFRLGYLDPDDVDLGTQFEAILPALWLAAGGVGCRQTVKAGAHYTMPADSTYAVLFRESRFRQFREALAKRPDITHVWLVTDSDEAFSEMTAMLPGHLRLSMLYRDYLRNFRINTDKSL